MNRRRAKNDGASFSLFPFLAVLLCTMGSLILVLVVIAQQTHDRESVRRDAASEVNEELQMKRDTAEWRIAQLKEARNATAAQLAEQRTELSHLEDHARRLRDELKRISEQREVLLLSAVDEQRTAQELRAKLADAEAALRAKHDELDRAIGELDTLAPTYNIIPYDGPNHTSRRPFYVECRENEIILQPEGIVLQENDFVGMMGPGNALAAALRAGREYIARSRRLTNTPDTEPYPLLLVRPDGIGAYYAAREAMTSWGTEFGYEFIEQDWQVKYQLPDSGLAHAMNRAVEEARRRQLALAMAAPRLLSPEERMVFRSSRGGSPGGFGMGNGGGAPGTPSGTSNNRNPGDTASTQQNSYGSSEGGTYGGVGGGYNGATSSMPATAEQLAAIYGGTMAPGGSLGAPGGSPGGGSFAPGGRPSVDGAMLQSGAPGQGIAPTGPGNATADQANNRPGQGANQAGPQTDGMSAAQTYGPMAGQQMSQPPSNSDQQSGVSNSAGGNTLAGQSSASQNGTSGTSGATGTGGTGTSSSSSSSSSSSAGGGGSGGPDGGTPSVNSTATVTASQSLAQSRGQNWGLPQSSRSGVLVTRPIQIECRADRLVLRSERGDPRSDRVVMINDNMPQAIDSLVAHVWSHIEGWGIAGRNMAWRPVLVMSVAPDASARYTDMRILLQDSGLELQETTRILQASSQRPDARGQ